MPFRLFHNLFPEVAEKETRCIFLPKGDGALPSGWYSFKEMFCDEPGCDCRRAFFWVDASFRDGPEAVIAWGWEDLAFYERWIKYGDKADAGELIGPILNPMSHETELAPHLLDLFKDLLLNDADYVERIKRHYWMFRGAIEASGAGTQETDDGYVRPADSDQTEATDDIEKTPIESTGECFLCHTPILKGQATRHVKACLKARPDGAGQRIKTLHLRVEGKYNPAYWMHIEIPSAWTLFHLDDFLRATWLECCNHMSCFTIGGQRYAYAPCNEGLPGRREKSMEAKLYKAIPPGTEFSHEYDYGSTTDLILQTLGAHEIVTARGDLHILARNTPLEIRCVQCRKQATIVEAGWNGLNPDRCFCAACAKTAIDDEGMRLPIVNSPRVGVCAYCG